MGVLANWLLCPLNMLLSFFAYFLAQQDIPGFSYTFPCQPWYLSFLQSLFYFMVYRSKIWALGGLIASGVLPILGLFKGESLGNRYMSTHTHTHTHIYIYIYTYTHLYLFYTSIVHSFSFLFFLAVPHSMWDLPGPGLEPVSPALTGGFLTTAPPGKSPYHLLIPFETQIGRASCRERV